MGSKQEGEAHALVKKEGEEDLFAENQVEEMTVSVAATAAAPTTDVIIDEMMLSDGAFPSLPEFPCLSSRSESPSLSTSAASTQPKAPCLLNKSPATSSSSSSSSSPWSFLKAKTERDGVQMMPANDDPVVLGSDGVGVLCQENNGFDIIGAMDLWGSAEPAECLDPSSIFLGESSCVDGGGDADRRAPMEDEVGILGGAGECPSVDLAKVFLDWLKSNKDSISPEDLRNIKLKRSTIECAASRLGGGNQGQVQLLKLILAWVQNHHLQRRKRRSRGATVCDRNTEQDYSAATGATSAVASQFSYLPALNVALPHETAPFNPNFDHYDATPCNSWMSYEAEPRTFHPMMPVYRGETSAPPPFQYYQDQPFSPLPPPDLHSAEQVAVAWQQGLSPASSSVHYSPFGPTPASPRLQPMPSTQYHAGFSPRFNGAQAVYSPALGVARLPSATKEARKNRMARHRRSSSLHNRNQQQHHQIVTGIGEAGNPNALSNVPNSRSWSFWSSSPPAHQMTPPADIPPPPLQLPPPTQPLPPAVEKLQRHASPAEKRRGLKSEKNLRFLLQKVLKQSDVGNLGRIVLPKKEAEIHLPELDARDGISIEMEDIGTSRVWNMRYRFWPNNKSRMYLLENTGDFVRTNGLQEGDFIVIYSDVKCGKYMIRGVKVRQQSDAYGASNRNAGKARHHQEKISSSNCKSMAEMELVHDYAGEVRRVSNTVKGDGDIINM